MVQGSSLSTPILLLTFNRLETTKRVLEAIREVKPTLLYLASDGPRLEKEYEAEKVAQVRAYLDNAIDWDCEVKKLYRDSNLGCKESVFSSIKWFFEQEEFGIVLEDDCLPSVSFFQFCQELLIKYIDDERIGMISGRNNLGAYKDECLSYVFSTGGSIWGWATWQRVVNQFDVNDKTLLDSNLYEYLLSATSDRDESRYLTEQVAATFTGQSNTWDFQWGVFQKINSMLAIVPTRNLIENIGFGEGATHTVKADNSHNIDVFNVDFPLKHPSVILADRTFSKKLASTYLPRGLKHHLKRLPFVLAVYTKLKAAVGK
ncbi:nucleotide-diphospho-sugar transferase [Imperialibacter roseus]|uniref:Nucleotide-diphospho-sugar transferase n=1 Tax=Imperialibacter roseus TaxID=1324217 RepID=A0ABZ0IMP0_9BACT|nr:nucleotide-diphospho-sugar transferase [Imperialibacter roseus]WOK06285.1 nucleotide-diphospho-sugar transferase [Imperialibacter roseus]